MSEVTLSEGVCAIWLDTIKDRNTDEPTWNDQQMLWALNTIQELRVVLVRDHQAQRKQRIEQVDELKDEVHRLRDLLVWVQRVIDSELDAQEVRQQTPRTVASCICDDPDPFTPPVKTGDSSYTRCRVCGYRMYYTKPSLEVTDA